MSLADSRATIFGKLQAEGYTVVDDPRNVVAPCILVGLPGTIVSTGQCLLEGTLRVTVIGTSPGNLDTGKWLLDTTEAVMSLLSADRATSTTTSVTSGNQRLPSYVIELPVDNSARPTRTARSGDI